MLKITAAIIRAWTENNKKDAENYLPELIRKLVIETCEISNLHIPSWDSTSTGWYDGVLTITKDNPFLPTWDCVIECGTNEKIRGKADDDYKKRCKNPNCNTSATNYIFATSRLFLKAAEWRDSKNEEWIWKSVKVLNSDDLEAWLELAPSTQDWFNKIAKLWPSWILSISSSWETFRQYIWKWISELLVVTDRKEQISKLLNTLETKWQKIEVTSDSRLESYWFTLAALKTSEKFSSKALVISNQEQWNDLVQSYENLILIPSKSFIPSDIWLALSKGHSIIFSSWKDSINWTTFNTVVSLPKMARESRINGLQEITKDKDMAESIYWATKWYFYPILRHPLLDPNESYEPAWLWKFEMTFLARLLFLTEWEEWIDEELVSACFWEEYKKIHDSLVNLSELEDSPIRKIGNVWQVISKSDLWGILWQKFSTSLMKRFGSIIQTALTDNDTSSEIPKGDRWMAAIHNKWPTYSARIKWWISDTLALLSAMWDSDIQTAIDNIVKTILNTDKTPYKILYDLWWNLQNIAEAAPEVFIEFIEKNLDNFDELFEVWWNFFTSRSEYIHLLWSLEKLAWNPSFLVSITSILIELSLKYDKKIQANYSNRPIGSLCGIYLFWQRWTSETIDWKLQVLEVFSKKYPKFIFDLILQILNTTSSISNAIPTYQNWHSILWPITNIEYSTYAIWAIKILVSIFKKCPDDTFVSILENIIYFPKETQNDIIDYLLSINCSWFKDQQALVNARTKVENILSRKKLYDEKLQIDQTKIIQLYNWLTPSDLFLTYARIFSIENIFIVSSIDKYKKPHDWKAEEAIANEERIKIVNTIYRQYWFTWIKKLITQTGWHFLLITAILNSEILESIYDDLYSLLWEQDENLYIFWIEMCYRLSFVNNAYINEKIAWLEREGSIYKKWRLILSISNTNLKFNLLRTQGKEIQDIFWGSLKSLDWYGVFREEDYSEANYVITELNSRWKYESAFKLLEKISHDWKLEFINTNQIFSILDWLVPILNNWWYIDGLDYHIWEIMNYLYEQNLKWDLDDIKILEYEIRYVKIIDSPKFLNQKLAESPEFFVELITKMYKEKNWKAKISTKEEQVIAGNVFHILSKFHSIPWMSSDWVIDEIKLNNYMETAIGLFKKFDRFEIWCKKLWEILAHSPVGSDGIWPCEAIRNVIEKFNNTNLNIGFVVWKRNQRGTTSRWMFEWWVQEKKLAEEYSNWANKLKISHRVTSKILRDIWEQYISEARREDERVEIDR